MLRIDFKLLSKLLSNCTPFFLQKSSYKVRNQYENSNMQTQTLSVKARLMNTLKMLKSFLKDNKDVDFISDEFIAIIP